MAKPAAVILKHNNPCGAAWDNDLPTAFNRALRCDRIAAFGGAVILNRPCDTQTAELLAKNYLEVVCAPAFEDGCLEILQKAKNLRIIQINDIEKLSDFEKYRFVEIMFALVRKL